MHTDCGGCVGTSTSITMRAAPLCRSGGDGYGNMSGVREELDAIAVPRKGWRCALHHSEVQDIVSVEDIHVSGGRDVDAPRVNEDRGVALCVDRDELTPQNVARVARPCSKARRLAAVHWVYGRVQASTAVILLLLQH